MMRAEEGSRPEDFGTLTKHGETRLKNCFKYELGNSHRLVTQQKNNVIYILYVGTHDEVDRWLDNQRNLDFVLTKDKKVTTAHITESRERRSIDLLIQHLYDVPLLAQLPANSLERLKSIPIDMEKLQAFQASESEEWLQFVNAIPDPELSNFLFDVMSELHEQRIDAAKARIELFFKNASLMGEGPPEQEAKILFDDNSEDFVNLRDLTEEEYNRYFRDGSFEDWMLFLHPCQRAIAYQDYPDPLLLQGVSGSGKTSVLIHRAKHLAEIYSDQRICVLTLNQALAKLIKELLNTLCAPTVFARISVFSTHEFYGQALAAVSGGDAVPQEVLGPEEERKRFRDFALSDGIHEDLAPIVRSLRDSYKITDPYSYLKDEFDWLAVSFVASDIVKTALRRREDYLDPGITPRRGRGVKFIVDWRRKILTALSAYEQSFEESELLSSNLLIRKAHKAGNLISQKPQFKYRAILVDEYQDLSTLEVELIKNLVPPAVNGLFFTGDLKQKIYIKQPALKEAGLRTVTRKYIKKNYRNTRQILQAGYELIRQFDPFQDDDEPALSEPEYSGRQGPKPLSIKAASRAEELAHVVKYVQFITQNQDPPPKICIVNSNLRSNESEELNHYAEQFKKAGISLNVFETTSLLGDGNVFISDIETVKGFEFHSVIITNVTNKQFPNPDLPEEEQWRDARKLYVSMTRARDELLFTYAESPSTFLRGLGDHVNWRTVDEEGLVSAADVEQVRPFVEDYVKELERLRRENRTLRIQTRRGALKVGEKGGVSLYGLGRLPVTLYKDQWLKLLGFKHEIDEFIQDNEHLLKTRDK